MNAKLHLLLFTFISCTTLHSMDPHMVTTPSLPQEIWFRIIARCSTKNKLRSTCTYFRDVASTGYADIFLQNPLICDKNLLEQKAFYFADLDNTAVIRNLLNQGLNPNIIGKKLDPYTHLQQSKYSPCDITLLDYATYNENFPMIDLLLNHRDFDSNLIIKSFSAALKRHCLTVAKYLLTEKTVTMLIPRYIARASDQNLEVLEKIFSLPHDSDVLLSKLLDHATREGHIKLATVALEHGANVHGSPDSSPIHNAVPYPRILKLLITYGADINGSDPTSRYDRSTPVAKHITNSKCFNGIQCLINHGASLVTQPGKDPLLIHVVNNSYNKEAMPLLTLLLNKGVDVNERKSSSPHHTALVHAICYRRTSAIPLLLAHPNIDVNTIDSDGRTPLDHAIRRRDWEVKESRHCAELIIAEYNSMIQQLIKHGGKTSAQLAQATENT